MRNVQDPDIPVAVKCITKRNLMKQADVLNKEVQILKVSYLSVFDIVMEMK